MQKTAFKLLLLGIIIVGISACSRKKSTFLSRNYHELTTRYNVLYNGNIALEEGLQELEQGYLDNYWRILPVERMKTDEDRIPTDTAESNPKFKRAEDKAAKAIQKHGMLLGGNEENDMIDEAYMLLGKARYYDQRFIPALEAFNYILQFMPESDNVLQARVWRERTNMRLENYELALANLQQILNDSPDDLEQEDVALIESTLAQAYLYMENPDSAIVHINLAANLTKSREKEARYHFITGQLFAELGQRDSAYAHYDHIIDLHRKVPRKYYLNAFIEKIKLFDPEKDSLGSLDTLLTELAENRENRPWLDRIYYQRAVYFNENDSVDEALFYYNKSLRENSTDRYMVGRTYREMGDIYFDKAIYPTAGKYYDSALMDFKRRTPEYRLVKKKRDNLQDVIFFEGQAGRADSIFYVLSLSKPEQEAYYQKYIDSLKAKEERLRKQAELAELQAAQTKTATGQLQVQGAPGRNRAPQRASPGSFMGGLSDTRPPGNAGSQAASNFYFYNDRTVARGIQQFKRRWGERKLVDNWRLVSAKELTASIDSISEDELTEEVKEEFTTDFYLDQLPSGQAYLDSLRKERDIAYFQLGVLYKEKFKRNDLSEEKLTTLLDRNPPQRLELPALYNLYLIYDEENAFAKANKIKSRIISDFPDTRYALSLQNPDAEIAEDDSAPKAVYGRIYKDFEQQNYERVISEAEKYIAIFSGDPIVPKLHLLKAFAKGRLYGMEEYKKDLDYVALNFPTSDEGKKAAELVKEADGMMTSTGFKPEKNLDDFLTVYRFKAEGAARAFQESLVAALEENELPYPTRVERYGPSEYLVIISGLKSSLGATGVGEILKKESDIEKGFFAIARDNYAKAQLLKTLDLYLSRKN